MDSIQITGKDASRIVLALISDKFNGQHSFQIEALETCWAELGLRLDDLVQGLTLLTREQEISIEGTSEGSKLTLSPATIETLSQSNQGIEHLPAQLKEFLKMAADRLQSDSTDPQSERRDGFH